MTLRMTEEQYAARLKKPRTRAEVAPPSPTHMKYKNRPTGGYASVKEARRAGELKLRLAAGEIRNLREQVEFVLIPKQGKERACKYFADFCYEESYANVFDETRWLDVVEDCKGMRTPEYIIKRKLMLLVHKIQIKET